MQKEGVWQNLFRVCLLSYLRYILYRANKLLSIVNKKVCTYEAVNIFSFQWSVKIKFSLFLYEKDKHEKNLFFLHDSRHC